ncbi:MAG: polysaccharide deacetylase family protein [Clostridia bacterium]|nr:polysaccharide deacetylase family protein [Clostridia bacterium]
MDKYSYDPNSRIARRIKERERKRRRNRRIRCTIITIIILVAVAVGIVRIFDSFNFTLPEFNPVEGFNRLVDTIKGDEPAPVVNDAPEAQETPKPEEAPLEESEELVPVSPIGYYPAPSENNNLLDIFKTAQGEKDKVCCLTFDDGPNKATTPEILDILAEYNIKATFFELGEKLVQNKDIAKRTYEEGHLLANHTYTQKYSTIYTSWDTFWDEVQKTEALITEITDQPAYNLVRMPGGSFNSGVYGSVKQEYRAKLAEKDYYFVDWSVDNGDDGTRNSDDILNYVKDYCGSKPVVLLMEDATARRATVSSLRSVIDYLKSSGYVFKRLDEIAYYSESEMPQEPVEEVMILPYDTFTRGYIL